MPAAFENRYKKSHVKTDKDCWTCRKTTKTCLLTDNYAAGGDFLYTCEAHLKDRNFATAIELESPQPAVKVSTPSVSQNEIDAAIKEYEERKKAKSGNTDDEKDTAKESGKEASPKPINAKKQPQTTPKPSSPVPPETAPEPTHFQLHKSFFDMRLRLHQQKSHLKDAQTRRSQLVLPSAPSDRPGASSAAAATK